MEWRLQIAAVVRQDGKLDGISLLRHSGAAVEKAAIRDLESWEFKPATRGGIPVDVDVVIEIPFILPGEVARRAEP
jgi:TonB family protein